MKLITETPNTVQLITESTNGKKSLYMEGVFATAERRNRNGRVYPSKILEREVSKYNEKHIGTNTAYGELSHPSSASINPDRVSHRTVSLTKEGNDFIGKAVIMDTPQGNTVKAMLETGGAVGVSTRGLGSLTKMKDHNLVNEDFNLVTVDAVLNPSNQTSFVNGVLENIEYIMENGVLTSHDITDEIKEKIEEEVEMITDEVKAATFSELPETKMKAFVDFMDLIKQIN